MKEEIKKDEKKTERNFKFLSSLLRNCDIFWPVEYVYKFSQECNYYDAISNYWKLRTDML